MLFTVGLSRVAAADNFFDAIKATDVDYIEITDIRSTRDTNLTWHPRRLNNLQVQDLCEKINSAIAADTPYFNYNSEFSILVHFKNFSSKRYFTKAGMIQQYHTILANIRTRNTGNSNYFATLWQNAREAECDCDVMTLADTIAPLNPTASGSPYFVLDSTHNAVHMNDEPFCFTVVKDSGDYFMLNWETDGKPGFIWLKKSLLMITRARNYSELFVVRAGPDRRQAVIAKFPPAEAWESKTLVVTNCSKGWVKVSFDFENRHYTGWVEYGGYCSNPYTTCN